MIRIESNGVVFTCDTASEAVLVMDALGQVTPTSKAAPATAISPSTQPKEHKKRGSYHNQHTKRKGPKGAKVKAKTRGARGTRGGKGKDTYKLTAHQRRLAPRQRLNLESINIPPNFLKLYEAIISRGAVGMTTLEMEKLGLVKNHKRIAAPAMWLTRLGLNVQKKFLTIYVIDGVRTWVLKPSLGEYINKHYKNGDAAQAIQASDGVQSVAATAVGPDPADPLNFDQS